ncbi:DMT family transporter [Novosphingobium sp. RD2P27]|uniref:DMT family transporter n=1 Tax=Novosphingobium kalidii TaxID=3230299 RepID=A0ABV2D1F7_9SPHN
MLAICLRLCAMALLATMFMLVKTVGEYGVASTEVMFWRQAVSVPLILVWLASRGDLGLLRTKRMASHAQRAALGTAALYCNVTAAMLLPLSEATTLGFTTPLFAVLITALVFRSTVGPWRWTAVVLGFVGVLIISQPGHEPVPPLGLAAGLGAGLLVALVSFQIRDLARTEAPISCVFWFAFYGALIASLLLPTSITPHGAAEWALLIAIGVCGTLAQLLITTSLRFGQVATVVVMDYTALVWSTLYGWLIWDRLPPAATWLGAPAIVAAGLVITWREHRLSRAISPGSALEEV